MELPKHIKEELPKQKPQKVNIGLILSVAFAIALVGSILHTIK